MLWGLSCVGYQPLTRPAITLSQPKELIRKHIERLMAFPFVIGLKMPDLISMCVWLFFTFLMYSHLKNSYFRLDFGLLCFHMQTFVWLMAGLHFSPNLSPVAPLRSLLPPMLFVLHPRDQMVPNTSYFCTEQWTELVCWSTEQHLLVGWEGFPFKGNMLSYSHVK